MASVHLRRSALYLPGSNARAIAKAATLDIDVIIFDLEDSVSPGDKPGAREQIRQAMMLGNFGFRELVIRINGMGTPFYQDDLRSAVAAAPDAILLSKVEEPEQILAAVRVLETANVSERTRLWCMLETPRGVLASEQIAASHARLDCLVMGTSDLTNDLHALHTTTRHPLMTSLGMCLLAARAHRKDILDGVCLDLSNEDAFVANCRQGREFGFDGKTLIHPSQIASCNAAFSPTTAEVNRAHAVVEAYAKARTAGRGVAVLEGRLVEELHVREAERTLALVAAIGARLHQSA